MSKTIRVSSKEFSEEGKKYLDMIGGPEDIVIQIVTPGGSGILSIGGLVKLD